MTAELDGDPRCAVVRRRSPIVTKPANGPVLSPPPSTVRADRWRRCRLKYFISKRLPPPDGNPMREG